jgi:hypothetical protein
LEVVFLHAALAPRQLRAAPARDLVLQSKKTDTVNVMAQFTTRVELHRATGDDYARLHSAMEQCGFSRSIQGADGNTYLLPTAEYERSGGDLTSDQIHNDAWRAAASVSQRFSILITEAVGITWSGLAQL